MKKKKIFLGLAIASAALFSLAACNSTSQSGSTSTPAASTSTPAASSSVPAASSTPAAADYTATFVAVVDGERDSALISKTATSSNGKFARPADADMAKEGYLFQGFYSNATVTTEFNFDNAVSANTTIYCKYHKMTQFDTLKADTDHLIFAEDFNSTTVSKSVVDKLSCKATTPTIYVQSETDPEFDGTQFNMGDAGKGILFDFGGAKSGIVKAYFEVSFQQTQGEAFAQFVGTDATKTDDEVFALRTSSKKFFYRFGGGSDVALSTNNAVTVNQKYAFFIELDTSEGKISITQDGVKVVDNVATTITEVKGFKFTCKESSDKHSKKSVDNVAITAEAKSASELVVAKNAALSGIATYTSSEAYTSLGSTAGNASANQAKKKYIDSKIEAARTAINTSVTVDEVNAAKTAWDEIAAAELKVVTVKAYTAAATPLADSADYFVATVPGKTVDVSGASYAGCAVSKIYSDADLTTEFNPLTQISADTTLYAKVATVQKTVITFNSITINSSEDGATTTLAAGVTYAAKSGATLKDVSGKTVEGTEITKALNTGGKSDKNKNYISLDFSSLEAGTKKKVTVYICGGGSGTRSAYISTTKEGLDNGKPTAEQTLGTIASVDQAYANGYGLIQEAGTYYIVYDNSVHIYGIVIEDAE